MIKLMFSPLVNMFLKIRLQAYLPVRIHKKLRVPKKHWNTVYHTLSQFVFRVQPAYMQSVMVNVSVIVV